ncbi:uncharacterized protein LOC132708039 [Cylas formicarius]|uniref:uncharacterized protein LOC132708039 n=1 Tax=Cylas formicarius TaxID=197179 RepID=UPI0029588086|nr:uncharacterized protein LOC132708039 [Cylas formicarius]
MLFSTLFGLFALGLSEWVEITKVSNKNKRFDLPKVYTTTSLYEVFLKPSTENGNSHNNQTHKPNDQPTSADEYNEYYYDEPSGTNVDNNIKINTSRAESEMQYDDYMVESEDDEIKNSSTTKMDEDNEKQTIPNPNKNKETTTDLYAIIKGIQNQLLKYQAKSVKSKISVLKNLRDSMLLNISKSFMTSVDRVWF